MTLEEQLSENKKHINCGCTLPELKLSSCNNSMRPPIREIYLDLEKLFAYSDQKLTNKIGDVKQRKNKDGTIHYELEINT